MFDTRPLEGFDRAHGGAPATQRHIELIALENTKAKIAI